MRISIRHEIHQQFAPPARSVIQILRLRPKDCESQHIASWNIDVSLDCGIREARDAFGNFVQTLDCEGAVETLTVLARGEVDTFDTSGLLHGELERFPTDVFLRDTDHTIADAEIRDFARATVKGAKTDLDRPHFLMRALHESMNLAPTESIATAAQAFERKAGGAEDFAHVFVAAARTVGIPARCVSGYLAPEDPGVDAGAHAWAEAHVDGLGWIGFDPTICLCMHDGHVRVACALDCLGCAPLRAPPLAHGLRTISISVKQTQSTHQKQS